ncbi:hypothetical protein RHS01_03229 [Rhizoctonia solani]|uniref:Uncharacterized protein n=1 Tax=Rhizoctonia solani TaxID=456999 RepID=A0A8H7IG29_9AGAM|nr:hypothetical protein RHS01_03229 [Rhizoctonia solani]
MLPDSSSDPDPCINTPLPSISPASELVAPTTARTSPRHPISQLYHSAPAQNQNSNAGLPPPSGEKLAFENPEEPRLSFNVHLHCN